MSKSVSTFDRMMQDADFKEKFEDGYVFCNTKFPSFAKKMTQYRLGH